MAWTKEELEEMFDGAPDDPREADASARLLIRKHIQKELEWLGDIAVERRHAGDDDVKRAIADAIHDEYGALVNDLWASNGD